MSYRKEVIRFLQALPDAQLLNVMQVVLGERTAVRTYGSYRVTNVFCLGVITTDWLETEGHRSGWQPWRISAVATVNPDASDVTYFDDGLHRFGTCDCGAEIVSLTKEGVCPICSRKVAER